MSTVTEDNAPPRPVLEIAKAFVAGLTGSSKTPMRLSFIDQRPLPKSEKLPTEHAERPIEELWPEVVRRQKEGYSVFYHLNEIKPGPGSGCNGAVCNVDVAAVRAFAIDRDNGSIEAWEYLATPKIIVHSKRGDQAIWPVKDVPIDGFKVGQTRLASHFGTDTSVSDPRRLFRLPGCLHLKDAASPFLVTFDPVPGWTPDADPLTGIPELPPAKPASAAAGEAVDLDHLRQVILPLIDPGCDRARWIRCVAAIRNSPVAAGVDDDEEKRRQIAHDFSEGKYWKGDPPANYTGEDDVEMVFNTMPPKAEGGVGYGSLHKFATDAAMAAGLPLPPSRPQLSASEIFSATSDDPIDVFDEDDDAEIEFPATCLPGILDRFCRDEAARKGVNVGMVALPALAVCGAALHTQFQIQPTNDTSRLQRPILWVAMVGGPGTRKTPVMGPVVAPLEAVQDRWFDDDQHLFARYEQERNDYLASGKKRENCKKEVGQDIAAAATNAATTNGSEPQEPPRRRLIVNDTTTEALANTLANNNGRGVLIHQDELAAVITSFDAYRQHGKGLDQARYLKFWDGGNSPVIIDRASKKSMRVKSWWASILGGIQPHLLQRKVGDLSADGLLQRFLVVLADQPGVGEDRPPKESGAYAALIRHLTELRPIPEAGKGVVPIRLSPEAGEQWRLFVEDVRAEITLNRDGQEAYVSHLDKMENQFARLLLIMHAVEAVAATPEGGLLKLPLLVSGETAKRVRRLFVHFLIPTSKRFYRTIFGSNRHQGHVQQIASFILTHCADKKQITPKDIYRHHQEYRPGKGGTGELQDAMRTLEAHGWVSAKETSQGRGVTEWTINPGVHVKYAERASAEAARKAAVRAEIAKAAEIRKRHRAVALTPENEVA